MLIRTNWLIPLMFPFLTAACQGTDSNDSESSSANSYSVSGTVSGLSGTGLVLQNNNSDDQAITADGTFSFATEIDDTAAYSVTVSTQPSSPSQNCVVTNDSGTIASADVTNVSVTCTDSSVATSVSPSEARVGDTITVSGQNFGVVQGSSTLSISGVVATNIISWNDTEIMATVPTGAGTGDVIVTVDDVDGTPNQLIVPWVAENPDNVVISAENSYQQAPKLISDGSGGAIIVWADKRNDTDYDIYAQRINSAGVVQWTANGVPIAIVTGTQTHQTLTSDGNGGAIIAWADSRGAFYDIYAQRINGAGVVQWATNGVVVCNAANSQTAVTMLPDGSGGAFVGWMDGRNDSGDTYIQRINSAGVAQWTTNGVAIAVEWSIQSSPLLATDGSGGALLVWDDGRAGASGLYGQRVNSAGVAQWTANGVAIVTGNGGQDSQQIASDGNGGVFVVWRAWPGANYDIYAQRINSAGVVQWATDGVVVSDAAGYQDYPTIVSDDSGGAIIAWQDSRNGTQWTDEDIYAQRINSDGAAQWTANGIAIGIATGAQYDPLITSDDNGGAIIVWDDYRNASNNNYAQHINSAGTEQWTTNGVAISTTKNAPRSQRILSDGYGGAIIAWQDRRDEGVEGDIYAQGITGSGLQ